MASVPSRTDNRPAPRTTLDARGLRCPEPLMLLHQAIRPLPPGALLSILATDPLTHRDIRNFCHHLGHRLLEAAECGGEHHFLLQKSPAAGTSVNTAPGTAQTS